MKLVVFASCPDYLILVMEVQYAVGKWPGMGIRRIGCIKPTGDAGMD